MINRAYPGDSDYVSPSNGGCWFCCRKDGDDLSFDVEFDAYVHLGCVRATLKDDPKHPEAKFMKYLLPEWDGND